MNGDAPGSIYIPITPAWQIALRGFEIGFGVAFGLVVIFAALGIFGIFPKKEQEA